MDLIQQFFDAKRKYQGDDIADKTTLRKVPGGYKINHPANNNEMHGESFITSELLETLTSDIVRLNGGNA